MSLLCRFVNADQPEYAQQQKNDFAGTNLFAYCCNDPINNVDYDGRCSKNEYKTQHDAAIAFAKKYIRYSIYVQFEFVSLIYSYYNRGKRVYGFTECAFGDVHQTNNPIELCQYYRRPKDARFVAIAHTHPSPNGLAGLSHGDFVYAYYRKIDIYSVGYDGSVHYYNHKKKMGNDEKIKSNVKILARRMSKKEKQSYENSFRYKWNAHINGKDSCSFGCKKLRWPVK